MLAFQGAVADNTDPNDGQPDRHLGAFGFVGTTGIIQYAVLSQHFPAPPSGRVNTTINLFSSASFLLQSLMGWVIGTLAAPVTAGIRPQPTRQPSAGSCRCRCHDGLVCGGQPIPNGACVR